MKNCSCLREYVLGSLLAAAFLLPTLTQGAGLTVTPNTVSNTYNGQITLQITGLTNGETVLLERFLDANANTVIDSGELLVQSFKVTDGQVVAFGGVRDTNVPGDDDGAANLQIQTGLSFSNSPEFSRGAGQHLFRVSSPTGRFTPVVQPLTVTQAAFGQRVTGQVTSGGPAVPGAFVALLVQVGNDVRFVAGAQADASGNYSLNSAPGTYVLLTAKSGFVADFSTAPMVTINSGQVVTQNLTLTPETRTISGRVTDAVTSNGVPALQLFLQSANNKFVVAFTDTNGNFSASAVPDQWEIDISDFSLAQSGYLRLQNKPQVDTTGGSVSGVSIQLAKETALIYGSLKNDTNGSLPGISLSGNDAGNQFQANATTDAGGNYTMGVTAGTWFIGPDNQNPGLAGYLVQGTNVTLTTGQALRVDFVALRATAHLLGRATDTGGSPVSDLTILAFPQSGGSSASATTAADGSFDLGVFGGSWTLQLESGSAAQHNVIGPSLIFTNVTDGVNISNISYVVRSATATISGIVTNSSGQPLANVTVNASTVVNGTNYMSNAQTDGSGNYQLSAFNGTWQVDLNCFELNQQGYGCPNTQNVNISGANGVANFAVPPGVQFTFYFRHFIYGGDFGSGFTPTTTFPITIRSYIATLVAQNDTVYPPPNNVLFTGPAGSGLTGTPADSSSFTGNATVYFSPAVTSPAIAPGGNWAINYKGNPNNFSVPDPQAASRVFMVVPAVTVNSGTLISINWSYKDANGGPLASPPAFVTKFQVAIFDKDLNLLDSSAAFPPSTPGYTVGTPVQWSNVGRVRMIYYDTLGNRYFINCNRAAAGLASAARPASNQFQFLLNGLVSQSYTVEFSTTLTNWNTLLTTNAPGSSFQIIDPNATAGYRFYRVRSP
jgi:hypothetical protein